ncbi:MAG TPA: 4-alpha-glucanotransferase [Chlamydiales bacterium]|nr:4-alpha-glucanotransferase [Chlamydiales bacterium]
MKTEEHWKKIGFYPHHGIYVSLSSLRTKKSCGVGEFLDLIPLIDWCKSLSLDCIQLLPLNDTGDDPSPYNALSSCALDPLYLSLTDLPDAGPLHSELEIFRPLTEMQRVAKNEVRHRKIEWLHRYFERISPNPIKNEAWLQTYALFKSLKDEYGGKSWQDWPISSQTPNPKDLEKYRRSIDFHCFLQSLCFSQLKKVHDYATQRGIFLKGDIPILLSPDSADVWAHRSLFQLDLVAGSPPDYYTPLGQKWGFPLFNWEEMRRTHFSWWKQRLQMAEQFYHLYRIDHVVGFFRIWAIPADKKPTEGHFVPSDPHLWEGQGRELLEMMISASSLLPIAEDLGTIPTRVRSTLREYGICGTRVIRWERHWEGDRSYIPFHLYDPFSLTTVSTADTEPLLLWWKNHPDEAIPLAHLKQWSYQPTLTHEQQFELLRDAHHTPSYFHINLLQEYLSLFPELTWPNLEDERINVPGTLLPTNWTYRTRPYLEEILAHQGLAEAMRKILHADLGSEP